VVLNGRGLASVCLVQRMDHGFVRGCVVMERRLGQVFRDAEYCVTFETAWIGLRTYHSTQPCSFSSNT
jgi:hypothetical protein